MMCERRSSSSKDGGWRHYTEILKAARQQPVGSVREIQCCFVFWGVFRAAGAAYGSSKDRDRIRAIASATQDGVSLGCKLHPRLTPQLMATPDPQPTERGQGSNPHPYGYQSGSLPLSHNGNSHQCYFERVK